MCENHEIKSLDLEDINRFDLGVFVVSRFVPKLPRLKKMGTVNTLLTASTKNASLLSYVPIY